MKKIADRKHLLITWRESGPRPDGRKRRFRRNPRPSNFYLQAGPLEIVWWYR